MSYPSNTTSLTRARPPKQLFFGSRINPVFRSQRFQTQLGQQPPFGFLHRLLKFFYSRPPPLAPRLRLGSLLLPTTPPTAAASSGNWPPLHESAPVPVQGVASGSPACLLSGESINSRDHGAAAPFGHDNDKTACHTSDTAHAASRNTRETRPSTAATGLPESVSWRASYPSKL
jgi:hypothetical protein